MMRALFRRRAHNISFGTASIEGVADETEKQNHMHRHLPRAGERPQRRMKKRVRLFKFQARLFAYV